MRGALVWFGGAIAWSLQLVLSYVVVGLVCGPPTAAAGAIASVGGSTPLLIAISVIAATGAAAAAAASFVAWRRHRSANGADAPSDAGSLALIGFVLNVIFLVVIIFGASAPLFLAAC